ncbi:MAG: hypothetical protein ACOH2L_13210 [Devosia sp.]
MIKNTLLAAVTAAALLSAAAPAMAGSFGDGDSDSRAIAADILQERLQEKGVNAASVEEWGNLVRAYVVQADGTQLMELFTPGTLTQVTP